jgi:hypothetical protein
MINQIVEKYLNAVKYTSDTYEVFVNPSKKELRAFSGGLRGLIDTKTKKLYIWSVWINHHNMVNSNKMMQRETGLTDFRKYWKEGDQLDHIFTFDSEAELDYMNSDNIDYIAREVTTQKTLDDMNALYDADWSFMKKYMNPNITKKIIADAINILETRVG